MKFSDHLEARVYCLRYMFTAVVEHATTDLETAKPDEAIRIAKAVEEAASALIEAENQAKEAQK